MAKATIKYLNDNKNISAFIPDDDFDCLDKMAKLAYILKKLRHHSDEWKLHYGSENKKMKERWEQRADEYMEQHFEFINITPNER